MKILKVIGLTALLSVSSSAVVFSAGDYEHAESAQDFIHEQPTRATEAWMRAAGGRIYDNWWIALDKDEPAGTHPSYPEAAAKSGSTTWRCKECHGWDYQGDTGVYAKGSHFTGITGIGAAIDMPLADIIELLRDDTHLYSQEMINDQEMLRIATFVSRGQIDMRPYIDLETRDVIGGDMNLGRSIFQTVCAACHGFDGTNLDWGDSDGPAYIGTEAVAAPDEVLNKILNAHPGVEMVNLRAFPIEYAAGVLAFAVTLPTE